LAQKIEKQWGSLKNFIEKFNSEAAAVQGSGWGWLGYNKACIFFQNKKKKKKPTTHSFLTHLRQQATDTLQIVTCPNQDPITTIMGGSLTPLLGIDVWEHAYYLQYKNARVDYLKAIWNVVNWKNVAERMETAKKA
jgi:Fe-Mn family superoxide dismutase